MKCPACATQNPADARFCGNCGRALVAQMADGPGLSSMYTADFNVKEAAPATLDTLATGQVVGRRYEIRAALGNTGSVDTYLAADRLTGQDVHLKVLRPNLRLGAQAQQQFLRDAGAALTLRHPGIAAIYDANEADGLSYIAMEAVQGETLRDWNRRRLASGGEMGMSAISTIIFLILDAITTIHINKLVRADLKPGNIAMLSDPADPNISLKLVDVGLPLADSGDTGGAGFGASPYRAPEALTAAGIDLQASADVYSISMIFYELLAGVPLAGHWQPPSTGRSDVPAAVDELIQNGLSNNPRRRPQSVTEYRDALVAAMGDVKPPRPRPGPGPGPKPNPTPNPTPEPKPEPIIVDTWKVPDFLVPILKTLNMPFVLIMMTAQNMLNMFELLFFRGAMMRLGTRKAARNGIALILSVVLIAAIGAGVWAGVTWYNSRSPTLAGGPGTLDTPVAPPVQPDPVRPDPVTPVQPSRFAAFNGYWTDDFGGRWNIKVDTSGRVRGVASGGPLAGSEMIGEFSGNQFQFAIGNAYGSGGGAGRFDGGCHINYQTLDPYGSGRTIDATLHVNHQPGAPCP